MSRPIRNESPMEFFKRRVERALAHQNVASSDDTTFYLTQLLDDFVRPHRLYSRTGVEPDQPLAEIFLDAVASHGQRRYELLKLTGDLALFLCGFLSESLNRSLTGNGYYVRLGGQAYGVIRSEHRMLRDLFGQLAEKFAAFADVLSEVSEECALTDDRNLLRLYERWRQTGSQRSAEMLRARGILVVPSSDAVH